MQYSMILPVTGLFALFCNTAVAQTQPLISGGSPLILDLLEVEQRAYDSANDVILGEEGRIETALRYQPLEGQFARLRWELESFAGEPQAATQELELLLHGEWWDLALQVDLELDFDAGGRGGTALRIDENSEATFLAYAASSQFQLRLHPFNFGGAIGDDLPSGEVTRIYYVEGFPQAVGASLIGNERIRAKTLPGLSALYQANEHWAFEGGAAAGRYLYPIDPDFDMESESTAEVWDARTDYAYKLAASYVTQSGFIRLAFIRHTRSAQTGALLDRALSLTAGVARQGWRLNWETGMSQAGGKALHVDPYTGWFANTRVYQPLYSDFFGVPQNWLGETDFGHKLQIGHEFKSALPFLAASYLGEHFIFDDADSAHLLRTAEETRSHGGLQVYTVGVQWRQGELSLQPELTFKQARQKVFGQNDRLRAERILSDLRRQQTSFVIRANYHL